MGAQHDEGEGLVLRDAEMRAFARVARWVQQAEEEKKLAQAEMADLMEDMKSMEERAAESGRTWVERASDVPSSEPATDAGQQSSDASEGKSQGLGAVRGGAQGARGGA